MFFFTQRDIFYEKISSTPITVCFPEFKGDPHDPASCINHIKEEIFKRDPKKKVKRIFVINATKETRIRNTVGTIVESIHTEQMLAINF